MSIAGMVAEHELLVCVGAGGVGKTTVAAALALGAALQGRRAAVLTIDPARALRRAFGLEAVGGDGARLPAEVVAAAGLRLPGTLDIAMLDQKRAWDAFIERHAPDPAIARALLGNAFYQQLSTRFAGASEYVAIEQLCRLRESGRYDLIVLDTPPAAHALDFVRAPERIDRMLDPSVSRWLPALSLGRSAWKRMSTATRFVLRRLERATGARTLEEVSAFFGALTSLVDDIGRRSREARALLRGDDCGFVLVATPRQHVLEEAAPLLRDVAETRVHLRAVVLNRTHPLGRALSADGGVADALLDQLAGDARWAAGAEWLARRLRQARVIDAYERGVADHLRSQLPSGAAHATVPELEHDLHSLGDLQRMAQALGFEASCATSAARAPSMEDASGASLCNGCVRLQPLADGAAGS
jgi:anion-transporting  ArsA/GET3 family ATPase